MNQKNFFREIAFLAVLNFFQAQKLIFGQFRNYKKWNLAWPKKIRVFDFFDFTNFFGLCFFFKLYNCNIDHLIILQQE